MFSAVYIFLGHREARLYPRRVWTRTGLRTVYWLPVNDMADIDKQPFTPIFTSRGNFEDRGKVVQVHLFGVWPIEKNSRFHWDLNSDRWIQSPECWPLHHGTLVDSSGCVQCHNDVEWWIRSILMTSCFGLLHFHMLPWCENHPHSCHQFANLVKLMFNSIQTLHFAA